MKSRTVTMDKYSLIGCLFIMAQVATAGSMGDIDTSNLLQSNFYIGGDLGVANLFDSESHIINPETHQLGAVSIVGGGLIGYDYVVNDRLLFGLEGFVDANALHTNIVHNNLRYKMNSTYNAGFRVLPSYALTPHTLGHLILGYSNGHFNINDNGVYGAVNSNFNKNGFQSGLGFTMTLPKYVLMRLDALYTTYAQQATAGTGLAGSGNAFQYYNNQFSTLAGELSLIYKFG